MAEQHVPNYINPQTRVTMTLAWLITSMLVMLLFVFARFWSRYSLKTSLGADDLVMAAAALCAIPVSVIGMASTNFGLGYHLWDFKAGWQTTYAKACIGNITLMPLACSLSKISLCLTYLRLFPSRTNKIFCWVAIVYLSCWALAMIFSLIFACVPVAAVWDLSITNKKCINFKSALLSTAALNSLSDFLVFLWPARSLWNIQLPVKQRLSLIMIFAVGIIVCVAGVCRMWYFLVYINSPDPYWEASILWCLSSTEVDLGIICGCLPSTKPLLARLFPRFFSTHHSHDGTSHNPHHNSHSFPFQSLSGRDAKGSHIHASRLSSTATQHPPKAHFAWASGPGRETDSDDEGRLVGDGVPKRGIEVREEVRVESVEDRTKGVRFEAKDADAGSEEWIIGDSKSSFP